MLRVFTVLCGLLAVMLYLTWRYIRPHLEIEKEIEERGEEMLRRIAWAIETKPNSFLKAYGMMAGGKYRLTVVDESAGPDENKYILGIVLEGTKVTVVEQFSPEEYTWNVFFTRELKRLLVMIERGLV